MAFLKQICSKADQVTLEADKMLRINRKQSEMGQLRKQVEQATIQLGNSAYGLHTQGNLSPELSGVCQQIDSLYAQIRQAEQEIERIRQETLPDPAPMTGLRCPACGFAIPEAAVFCPNCGSPRPKPQPTSVCASCGNALPVDAHFCANCGQVVTAPSPDSEPSLDAEPLSDVVVCVGCQAEISAQATFCPLCGTPVAGAAT